MKKLWSIFVLITVTLSFPAYATGGESIPASYREEVRGQEENTFNRNAVLAFVYNTFFMFDKHVPVDEFLKSLVDKDLLMQFPEATLKSHDDFRKWYAGIGENIKSNTHTVKSVVVSTTEADTFKVQVIVLWQAENKKGEYLKFLADQTWVVREDHGRLKIREYVVKAAK